MGDNEYWYYYARDRYYNACSEINSCQNRINTLNGQKTTAVNRISHLKCEISKHEGALDGVETMIKIESGMNDQLKKISEATADAAENYSGMIKSGDITSKNLNDVFANEMTTTKQTLSGIFSDLRQKKSKLNTRITELKNDLKTEQNNLENITSSIRFTENNMYSWQRTKLSAAYDMEYYKRKMNEVI